MKSRIYLQVALFAVLMLQISILNLKADVVRLENGGEVRGQFDQSTLRSDSKAFRIETLNGVVVVITRDHLQFISRRPLEVEEYETRAKQAANTVSAQWELAEWCYEKRLSDPREECLLRIVSLEPNHKQARRALGHRIYKGEWMTHDAIKRAEGFVKYRGKYITTQEMALIRGSNIDRENELAWYKNIRIWKGWIQGNSFNQRNSGLAELQKITDPDAVAALIKFFQDSSIKPQRTLYVNVLSGIPGERATHALVEQSLIDFDYEIRFLALDAIRADQYETASIKYTKALKSDHNHIIQRAAAGLAKVGGKDVIPKLIDALITTHVFRVKIPDRSNTYSFGTDGSMGNSSSSNLPPEIEGQLRTGQLPHGVIVLPSSGRQKMKIITLKRNFKNSEVLAVLRKMTGQSFSYDKRSWRLWLSARNKGLVN